MNTRAVLFSPTYERHFPTTTEGNNTSKRTPTEALCHVLGSACSVHAWRKLIARLPRCRRESTKLLAVPETLEVEVEGEHATLEHTAEAPLASILPLAVDDLSNGGGGQKGAIICFVRTEMRLKNKHMLQGAYCSRWGRNLCITYSPAAAYDTVGTSGRHRFSRACVWRRESRISRPIVENAI